MRAPARTARRRLELAPATADRLMLWTAWACAGLSAGLTAMGML